MKVSERDKTLLKKLLKCHQHVRKGWAEEAEIEMLRLQARELLKKLSK